MDNSLTQRRVGLEQKIPDIKKTLSMVEFLQERRVSFLFQEKSNRTHRDAYSRKGKVQLMRTTAIYLKMKTELADRIN